MKDLQISLLLSPHQALGYTRGELWKFTADPEKKMAIRKQKELTKGLSDSPSTPKGKKETSITHHH